MLASTTWEEAPPVFRVWLTQRTRWLKGWMQTYLVHTRELRRLNRELGFRAAIGFHTLMGGLIGVSSHAPSVLRAARILLAVRPIARARRDGSWYVLWTIALINLAVGYAVSILIGIISVWRRRRPALAASALLMPLY